MTYQEINKQLQKIRKYITNSREEIIEKTEITLREWIIKGQTLMISCFNLFTILETHPSLIKNLNKIRNDLINLINNITLFSSKLINEKNNESLNIRRIHEKHLFQLDKSTEINNIFIDKGLQVPYLDILQAIENILNQVPIDPNLLKYE